MSEKKLLLKEIKKKTVTNTKQLKYCELFETTSSGVRNFFKNTDIIRTRGETGSIEPKWRDLPVGWRETAGL